MRKIAAYLIVCALFAACKKDEVIVVVPSDKNFKLTVDQEINDSTIVLKWTKSSNTYFKQYKLFCQAYYLRNGQIFYATEVIDSSYDVNHVTFTDKNMPLTRFVNYYVHAYNDTTPTKPQQASFNYTRRGGWSYDIPQDVLWDGQKKWLYVTGEQKISIVNPDNSRVLLEKDFPAGIGYCYLGEFNGSKELYVPVDDGWLQILDAATLQLKDRIYVAGYEIGSVVATNGKLYVSSSDKAGGGYSNCVKVYDRATKNFIGRTGYYDRTRLVLLEGSNTEMVDLTINIGPAQLYYYQFDANGVPLVKKEDTYHGDFQVNAAIVRSFPDGSRFITAGSGTIFNKSLLFDRYLTTYGGYTDFAFNTDGSIIYAAHGEGKRIDVITYPATTVTGNYKTSFYPYKIFRDGNTLICVNKTLGNLTLNYLLVEKINL